MKAIGIVTLGCCLLWLASPIAARSDPGSAVWVARYDGPGNFLDIGQDVAVSPDGEMVYVTGLSDAASGAGKYPLYWADYATVAYDANTGAERWVARHNGPGDGWDSANAIALSPDARAVYVTGGVRGTDTRRDIGTIAYDATDGTERWVAYWDGPKQARDSGVAVLVSPDGTRVFVAGRSDQVRGPESFVTIAYDAATGEQLWTQRVNECGHRAVAWAAAQSPDGSAVFVTGWEAGCGRIQARTVALDATTGGLLWSEASSQPVAGYAIAISNRSVFITGTGRNGFDTVAYDAATGETQWLAGLDPQPRYGEAWSVAVSPDGRRVFVTGLAQWRPFSGCYYRDDYTTVAYDSATGAQIWLKRYNGPGRGEDFAQSIGMSPDGATVYVTGESSGFGGVFSCRTGDPRTGQDYATVAYEAGTGDRLWVERYDSPERGLYDRARALAVSPDGAVYVTGEGHGGGYRDYATIKYPTA